MGFDPHEPHQRRMLAAAMAKGGLDLGDFWLRYFSLGGAAGEYEVEAYLQGLISLPVLQRDLLAMAANELLGDTPQGDAPYSDELAREDSPDQKPGPGKQ